MGSIDTPTFLRDKMKQSQSSVKPGEGNAIDVPQFLKKKDVSNGGAIVSGNGLSSTPKVEVPVGQLPDIKGELSGYIKAPVIPKGQGVNEAVSTQSVQPKITASYDDFVEHNAERKKKKSGYNISCFIGWCVKVILSMNRP